MRRVSLPALAALIVVTVAPSGAQSTPPLSVRTSLGIVTGRDSAGVARWLGVPFAAAPVGNLRWRAPQPPAAWSTPRDAAAYGPICMQTDALTKLFGGVLDPVSEDCLTLNVWSASPAGSKRPVLVWIHGGAFTHGSGRTPLYEGTRLALQGTVVVTINYRLGIFGFLTHAALSAESPARASGHYGFLDQVAALRWVKREIAAFGGDPDNVTIFGESAGAFSVGYHLVSPLSRGLFHRAILQSGTPLRFPLPIRGDDSAMTAERKGAALVARLGGTAGPEVIARLRSERADSLLARAGNVRIEELPEAIDGEFLVEAPAVSLRDGRVARVPVIVGSNADESSILVRDLKLKTQPELDSAVRAAYPAFADRVLALYTREGPQGPVRAYRQLWSDDVFTAPARETARALTKAGVPVYRYYYTRVANGLTGLALGAFHASEVPFVFGVRGVTSPLWGSAPGDTALAVAMSGAWARFAAGGDPNQEGLPSWPRFTVAGDEAMEFGARIGAMTGPRPGQLDVLGEILAIRTRTSQRATIRAGSGT